MSKRRYSDIDMPGSGSRTLATKKYVKKCMRNQLETKTIVNNNIVGNGGVPTTSGRVDPIQSYNIIQGTTDDSRLGNFIRRKALDFRFITTSPANATGPVLIRVVLVHDKQTNGATPAVAEILSTSGGPLAGFNKDNVIGYGGTRFRIMKDLVTTVNPDAVVSVGVTYARQSVHRWRFRKNVGTVQYDATAGVITDIVSGEIFLVTISDNATAIVQGTIQTTYTDE